MNEMYERRISLSLVSGCSTFGLHSHHLRHSHDSELYSAFVLFAKFKGYTCVFAVASHRSVPLKSRCRPTRCHTLPHTAAAWHYKVCKQRDFTTVGSVAPSTACVPSQFGLCSGNLWMPQCGFHTMEYRGPLRKSPEKSF